MKHITFTQTLTLPLLMVINLLIGCSCPPARPHPSATPRPLITPFPIELLPSKAPRAAKVRCDSLPDLERSPEKATIKSLLIEVQKARSAYAECANRHNVLVDFQAKQENGIVDIYNHYNRQVNDALK